MTTTAVAGGVRIAPNAAHQPQSAGEQPKVDATTTASAAGTAADQLTADRAATTNAPRRGDGASTGARDGADNIDATPTAAAPTPDGGDRPSGGGPAAAQAPAGLDTPNREGAAAAPAAAGEQPADAAPATASTTERGAGPQDDAAQPAASRRGAEQSTRAADGEQGTAAAAAAAAAASPATNAAPRSEIAPDVIKAVLDETIALPERERSTEAAPLIVKINEAVESKLRRGGDATQVWEVAAPRVVTIAKHAMGAIAEDRRAALRDGATPTSADEIAYVEGVKLVMRQYLHTLERLITARMLERVQPPTWFRPRPGAYR